MTLIDKHRSGFTLVELLVVVGMIAVIIGSMSTSFTSARERAKVQKATAEVKIISQAILAYENWSRGGDYKLDQMTDRDADAGSLDFLLGNKTSDTGDKIPVMLMAQLQSGGKMLDPWGRPYKITIKQGTIPATQPLSVETGYFLPNFYRGGAK